MNGDEIIEDGVVLVEGNRIQAVGKRGTVAVPAGAKTDRRVRQDGPAGIDRRPLPRRLRLATASRRSRTGSRTPRSPSASRPIHDPSNDTGRGLRGRRARPRRPDPRARASSRPGRSSTAPPATSRPTIDSLEDAVAHLRRMKAVGAISVKSYNQPRREQRQQILAGARDVGIMVVPEGGSLFELNMTMVVDGHTTVEHTIPVANIYEDVSALWPPGQGRLHAHAPRRLRRDLRRELLVPEDERLGEPAPLEVRAGVHPRSPLPPPHDGARRRVQPLQTCARSRHRSRRTASS